MKSAILFRTFLWVGLAVCVRLGSAAPSFAAPPLAIEEQSGPVALVYRGPGSCKEGCSEAAAEVVARHRGLRVRFVGPEHLTERVFRNAVLWIQPGGNAITAARTLGVERMRLIEDFVSHGGGYVGFCAGAFLADRTVNDKETIPGLGLIPISTADYQIDSGEFGVITQILWGQGAQAQQRDVFFSGGATFVLEPARPVRVLATYVPNGEPAAIATTFGRGRVVISGFHPEATDLWKSYANGTDRDGSDIFIAENMLDIALGLAQ